MILQAKVLYQRREFHLGANHLFKNIVALCFVAVAFKHHKLIAYCENLLCKELNEQSDAKGLHYEYSPTYHAIFLLDLLNLYNLYRNNPVSESDRLLEQLKTNIISGLFWIDHLSQQNHYFNIADVNYEGCPKPNFLIHYADKLKISKNEYNQKFETLATLLLGNLKIMLINTPFSPDYNAAHSHADKLSILLWYKDQPILIDTGNYNYLNTTEREYARSVAAHNTIQIDKQDQAEMWGAFRIGNRGKITSTEISDDQISSTFSYKQYQHTRTIRCTEKGFILNDHIKSAGDHEFKIYFHLPADISFTKNDNQLSFENGLKIILPDYEIYQENTQYFPRMYCKLSKLTFIVSGSFENSITLTTKILI